MINDPIEMFFEELQQSIWDNDGNLDREVFEELLKEHELMVAPVMDPTNLFGVMEDSL